MDRENPPSKILHHNWIKVFAGGRLQTQRKSYLSVHKCASTRRRHPQRSCYNTSPHFDEIEHPRLTTTTRTRQFISTAKYRGGT